jgi:histidinol-phosphatase (PHP family)
MEYHDGFYEEAVRLREMYKDQIDLLVGIEGDWIRGESKEFIENLLSRHHFDFFVSSVHHVHTIPIDFDTPFYVQAREVSGGKDEELFADYFDAQFAMLEALKPPVVGHFDLIRLKSDDPERSFRQWPEVWRKIVRNLGYVASYGGLLELNFASIRKGMSEPYPKLEICEVSWS